MYFEGLGVDTMIEAKEYFSGKQGSSLPFQYIPRVRMARPRLQLNFQLLPWSQVAFPRVAALAVLAQSPLVGGGFWESVMLVVH